MRNVCLFINTLYSGGAEKQVLLLAKSLKGRYNVSVVLFHGDKIDVNNETIVEKNNIQVVKLEGSKLKKIASFYRFIKKEDIDVVFSFLLLNNVLGGVLNLLISKTVFVGGIRSSFLPKKKIFLNRIACNFLNRKTVINNFSGIEFLRKHKFNINKVEVIPNGIELPERKTAKKAENIIKILSVGRFDVSKDYFTSLKVIADLLKESEESIEYTVVGYGELEKDIRAFIQDKNIGDNVKVVINPENLEDYYRNASIFLQSSIFEGMSNTLMEAMSFSLPIVTTDVGDSKILVKNDFNGYVCEPKNSSQILAKLSLLVKDHKRRTSFGENSFKRISNNFSVDVFSKKYINLIENL